VIRELKKQRVWFAEPLISSSYAEIRKVIRRAKNVQIFLIVIVTIILFET